MENQDLLGQDILPEVPPTADEKTMALLSHILSIIGGFIAPLVIYLLKKDESAFVSEHAKESLNFQITLFIAYVISFLLIFVIIGIFLLMLIGLLQLILVIVATIKANEGKLYKYPFNIRFIK